MPAQNTLVPERPKTKADFILNWHRNTLRRTKSQRDREERNWRMYSGVNYGQWDKDALEQIAEEDRAPHQVNFTQNKVNALLGSFLQDPLEGKFESEVGTLNNDSIAMNTIYINDKRRQQWGKTKREFLRAGLVFRGVCEMVPEYKYDPRGNISLEYWNPFHVIFDADWTTDNVDHNKRIQREAWLSPSQIQDIWETKSEQVKNAAIRWKQYEDGQTDEVDVRVVADRTPETYDNVNDLYLVIQDLTLVPMTERRLFDLVNKKLLPPMSDEDEQMLMAIKPHQLRPMPKKFVMVMETVVVPGLDRDLTLADGPYRTQIGRYPIFTWSYLNLHGEIQGIVDGLGTINEIYNSRQSMYSHWQMTALNGAEFYEEDFFSDPDEAEDYKTNSNRPGSKYKVRAGALSQQRIGIAQRGRGQAPTDLVGSANEAFSMAEVVSMVPSVLSGGEGKSGESGDLFQGKRQQALVPLEPTIQSINDLENEFLDAYFYMARIIYSGAPRRLTNPQTKDIIDINIPMSDGSIMNDISKISRMNIIITKSRTGVSVKRENLARYFEISKITQNPLLKSWLEKKMISFMPNISDEDIAEMEPMAQEFVILQYMRIKAEEAQLLPVITQAFGPQGAQPGQNPMQAITQQANQAGGQMAADAGLGQEISANFSVEGQRAPSQGTIPVDLNNVNQIR